MKTKFKLFVLPPYVDSELSKQPEVIEISVPTNKIKKGPIDDRFQTIDALFKAPYDEFSHPPFRGSRSSDVKPGPDGHFTHLDTKVTNRAFCAASMYATVRLTLDIWEVYFGRRIEWPFRVEYKKMEIIPLIEWDNAQSGYGFLEFGYARNANGSADHTRPYCLNFDVLAHELGHSIIFSEVGYPQSQATATIYYRGFHESAADLTAIVASLHFNKIIDHLLESTHGNLFSENELSRIGEVGKSEQIRMALNYEKMSSVSDEPHDLSLPLTGAFFDIFVEMFQKELVKAKLITADLAARSFGPEGGAVDLDQMEEEFAKAYKGKSAGFKKCLVQARDEFGKLLAKTWEVLEPDNLDYLKVAQATLDADIKLFGGEHEDTIRACFKWREISAPNNSFLFTSFSVDGCRPRGVLCSKSRQRHLLSTSRSRSGSGGNQGLVAVALEESGQEVLERSSHSFCVNIATPWVIPRCDFPTFKDGQTNQFKFHQKQYNTPTDQQTDIREFAALLHERLQFGHPCKTNLAAATGAVRATVTVKDAPMQTFLDVLAEHYQ